MWMSGHRFPTSSSEDREGGGRSQRYVAATLVFRPPEHIVVYDGSPGGREGSRRRGTTLWHDAVETRLTSTVTRSGSGLQLCVHRALTSSGRVPVVSYTVSEELELDLVFTESSLSLLLLLDAELSHDQ